MKWLEQLNGDPLAWLLERGDPGVRYLALRDLLDCPPDDPELRAARAEAHAEGPIATILAAMKDAGYWEAPGAGYNPKYRSTVWALIALAQLGGSVEEDARIGRACAYLLDHGLAAGGQFTTTRSGAPSGTVDCLQGNLCAALLDLGCDDPRLEKAFEWMARSVTGDGVAPATAHDAPVRYYAYKCGPRFACGANGQLACAWGGVKVMLALSKWPAEQRTPLMERAIEEGIDFFLTVDPATADYPTRLGDKPSRNWWKFGFPVFYVTDLIQLVEALVGVGVDGREKLANSLAIIRDKQDEQGRWSLDYAYTGKTWVDFGAKRLPNKWVTERALRVLTEVGVTAAR